MVGTVRRHGDLEVDQLSFEVAETQAWLNVAIRCQYLDSKTGSTLLRTCDPSVCELT
jgi:hypothetical protein